jgi:hypothetical protein
LLGFAGVDYTYSFSWPVMLLAAAVVVVVGLAVAWGVRALERRNRAELGGAERIQTLVGEALAREPQLRGASILPVASLPVEGRSSLELTGYVSSAAARERAVRVARGELARVRPGMEVVDSLSVVPSLSERRQA